jgi:hypothetical protein
MEEWLVKEREKEGKRRREEGKREERRRGERGETKVNIQTIK